ncbi:unnamed protein product [Mycena citricolor]|uniref:Uncharacterized protein n=1 Tax=Mycena citricolor TaxID=2018698 RepID=A0AAD2H2B6_9AGAR|nr:unnamed protein product [Mycena citricolor]
MYSLIAYREAETMLAAWSELVSASTCLRQTSVGRAAGVLRDRAPHGAGECEPRDDDDQGWPCCTRAKRG